MDSYLHVRDFIDYPVDESYSTNDMTFDMSFKHDKILLVGIEFLNNDINVSTVKCSQVYDSLIIILDDININSRKPEVVTDYIYVFRAYDGHVVKIIVNEEDILTKQFRDLQMEAS